MARNNRTGTQTGLNAGFATDDVQEARHLNQNAATRAGNANANFETSGELGTGANVPGIQPNTVLNGVPQARQLNQQAIQNAGRKAGR